MKTIYFILVLFLLAPGMVLHAQSSFSITGTVADSTGTPLPGATVMLMEQADSMLVSFGITDNGGAFSIPKTKKGDYLLQITYVGYQMHSRPLALIENLDLGQVRLEPQSTLLKEVLVKGEHIPIAIRNDTIEYNATAFQVEPNAPVEDLLKKLPGVEVDRAGNIKAQGEQVNKVLVDGKEFFGNDPKIATKNLPADAVDKVQVFDKKSEMAEFSGIEDGQEDKTINLALKEDKKQGYFGNVSAGYGTDDRYQGKASINRFSKTLQLSALGMLNNINEQGFSLNDYLNFMGGMQNMMAGGGSFRITLDGDQAGIPLDIDQRSGITTTSAGGLHTNVELSDKTELNASYFYNRIGNDLQRDVFRENLLGMSAFSTTENTDQQSRNTNHRFNATLRHEIDSTQRLIIRGGLGYNDAFLENARLSQTLGSEGALENTSQSNFRSDGTSLKADLNGTYLKRFRKAGRVFTSNLNFGNTQNENAGTLYSENAFLPNLPNGFTDTLHQRQRSNNGQLDYGGRLSYTEPVGKGKYLEANYTHQNYSNELAKDFYDITPAEEVFNQALSRHYTRDYNYDRGGLNFRYNRKNLNLTLGAGLQHSRLKGELIEQGLPIKKTFTNFVPSLRGNYEFTSTRHIEFDYETSVREPSLEQLQPIVDNSDPLNTYTGNPDLRPEYSHSIGTRFMSFDQFSNTNIFANLQARYTRDRITNTQTIDSLFRQHITPVNVDWDWEGDGYFSFGTALRFIKSRISFDADARYNRSLVFVNGLSNISDRWSGRLGLSLENSKKKWLDAVVGVQWGFNTTRLSESEALNQDFFEQTLYADVTIKPTKNWTIDQSIDYTAYRGSAFANTDLGPIWRASITRRLWKNKLELKLSAFDLLNRNTGISRSSQFNYLQEERVNALGRYVMLSATYALSGFGSEGGLQVITRRR
ncbi:MAG: TonB-dependent receptor [Lewinellaceae bacterium]|nr:TonB-dependent receptor [Lewinellaceae bacterium]